MEPRFFDEFLRRNAIPPEVDVEAIRQEWLALCPSYRIADRHLHLPVWARRSFTETGDQAWQTLCRDVPDLDPQGAFCIYVHIPFCADHCEFCDCYSFRLAVHREQYIDHYLGLLDQEIHLWSRLGTLATRPVSTVHFGGGTPTYLGVGPFARLVQTCWEQFATGPETEWALESTVSELSPEMLSCLDGLGFTRLHIGVQSLQDEVRRSIKRRATVGTVLDTIATAVERGWIVSVDLVYGLPGQTFDGLVRDIQALVAVGVDGFSLYELQMSARNRKFIQRCGLDQRDRRLNYFMNQVAARTLLALGYKKTLFSHYAKAKDTNLYFTFPARGEDCLALGTTADGLFGDYHYRHPEYAAYCQGVNAQFPGLEGGLRRNDLENRLQPLTIALMAGSVPPSLFADPASQALLPRWRESRLLVDDPQTGNLWLTSSGSWFLGNMISQLIDQNHVLEGQTGDAQACVA
jgi:coproporphyrinogen III oxidase-like Fe-S oxidoreductase